MNTGNVKKYHAIILCGILCLLLGSVFAVRRNDRSRELITAQQDEALFQLADSADKNLENILSKIQNQIYYMSSGSDFKAAETDYLENGRKSKLWAALRYNSLFENDLIECIIAKKNGSTFLSTKEDFYNNVFFYDNLGNYRAKLCHKINDKYYMAFQFSGNYSDIDYYALISLNKLYLQIVDDASYANRIILYNSKLGIVITSFDGYVKTMRMDEYVNEGFAAVGECLEAHEAAGKSAAEKLIYNDKYGIEKRQYMAVYPSAQCENKNFSVAVITDYDKMFAPLKRINENLFGNMLLAFAGIGMLFYGYMLIQVENKKVNIELEELKEKNEAAKELLESTKKLEHAQRLELLGAMTSGTSHEFNNLLTPIMGYSIMSLELVPEGNDELAENIVQIYNASKKAKDIVKHMSELSKKNSSDSLTPINMDELVLRVKSMISPSVPKNVRISTKLYAGEARVMANETQMTQVIMNIMLNGIHAMEEKGGMLSVSTLAESGNTMRINIKDSGTGIEPEVLPHIFDPFFTTKEAGKGTGLGLAIVKNILDELDAKIQVVSEPGQGTEFIIKLYTI